MRTVDLLFFMGQSNMAGRGDAALAPVIAPGMGYEYRAVTDPTPAPAGRTLGVNENDPAGVYEPGMKTGSWCRPSSMPAPPKPVCRWWACPAPRAALPLPSGCPAHRTIRMPCAAPASARLFAGKRYIIRHSAMVWCQGCTRRRPAHPQGHLQSRHRARSAQLYAGRRRANLLFDPNRQPAR